MESNIKKTENSLKEETNMESNIKKTENSLEELPYVMNVQDVASIMRIGRDSAYDLCRRKGFPAKRIGRSIRIPRDRFINWLNSEF